MARELATLLLLFKTTKVVIIAIFPHDTHGFSASSNYTHPSP
ncbi:uncharacterized protein G2W53_007772 [Senna tora]|uniref:Uncharacterized protein n=1 Tax=Senna tora TaxID=362788 RepID=A0A834X7A6_9FABA|nr:uncharacterized protein G2W53_007772 [Senna tora]